MNALELVSCIHKINSHPITKQGQELVLQLLKELKSQTEYAIQKTEKNINLFNQSEQMVFDIILSKSGICSSSDVQ